ncbi:MAG: D-2-hydroxyacid dehydrogenase [Bacteroidota bacterium]
MPKIVVLDGHTLNQGDLSWDTLKALGTVEIYERSAADEIIKRAEQADIILSNKVPISKETIAALPKLKYIGVMATGYNNIAIEAARIRNIPVCNASGYSTTSVAQHVFALILALLNRVEAHHASVQVGQWSQYPDFSYTLQTIHELARKTLGIYGLGKIGNKVADIALAFDMKVLATHKHPIRDARLGVDFVELPELFAASDFISLHAPLSVANRQIVNRNLLEKMRPSAYLINTGRGGLIHEADLKKALINRQLAGVALDVLSQEPPPKDHPLLDVPNCIITPHMAWASLASRTRLMNICVENIKAFLDGKPQNVVNGAYYSFASK